MKPSRPSFGYLCWQSLSRLRGIGMTIFKNEKYTISVMPDAIRHPERKIKATRS
jgi:hypothetical protein